MRRFASWTSRVIWPALLLIGGGYGTTPLHIRLAAFRQGDINTVWLWKQKSDGTYARMCQFVLSDSYVQSGVEVVTYLASCGRTPFRCKRKSSASRETPTPSTSICTIQRSRTRSTGRRPSTPRVESPLSTTTSCSDRRVADRLPVGRGLRGFPERGRWVPRERNFPAPRAPRAAQTPPRAARSLAAAAPGAAPHGIKVANPCNVVRQLGRIPLSLGSGSC